MKLHCPDCGAQIPAEDVNLQTLLARCRKCDSVFAFGDVARAEAARGMNRVSGQEAAAVIPRPPRIRVDDTPSVWTATWRWFSPAVIMMVLFCIAWDSFLIFWYSIALTKHGPWLMIVFPIAHVGVGVSLTYTTLATLFNSTRIRATRDELVVQSGPVPWIGNRMLPATAIRQIFTRSTNSMNNRNMNSRNNANPAYGVFAVLGDGQAVRLVGGLKDASEAGFLQQQLEKRLGVRPSPLLI